MSNIDFYKSRISSCKEKQIVYNQKGKLIMYSRFIVFLLFFLVIYKVRNAELVYFILPVILVIIFLYLLIKTSDLKNKSRENSSFLQLNERLLASVQGEFNPNFGGEYQNDNHAFSSDLDFFTPNGLFSFLNWTSTSYGEKSFVFLLLNGTKNKIRSNKIIKELSDSMEWNQKFYVSGVLEKENSHAFVKFSTQSMDVKKTLKIYASIYPVFSFGLLFLFFLNVISSQNLMLLLGLLSIPSFLYLKKIGRFANVFLKNEEIVKSIFNRLLLIDSLKNQKEELKEYLEEILGVDNQNIEEIKRFMVLIDRFSYRSNKLLGLPLTLLLAWDIKCFIWSKTWIEKNSTNINLLQDKLGELECFISGAIVKYNYPSTVFSSSSPNEIEILNLIHPLLAHKNPISNNFKVKDYVSFGVLTGSNMSGKSTFLRSIGVSITMSQMGFPVFASKMVYPDYKLLTSMRNRDNLSSETSYFYSELKRLSFILDELKNNRKAFVLLDEILKGTNSDDKQAGSSAFVEKISKNGAKGIIATHDLSLCTLSDKNSSFVNLCFDSKIENGTIEFDYLLKEGVCSTQNATFLMKQMNIID